MPFKAPLTYAELRAIRERQSWNADVIALLWEIKRLRSVYYAPTNSPTISGVPPA